MLGVCLTCLVSVGSAATAGDADEPIDQAARTCITRAAGLKAIAQCERLAQEAWQASIAEHARAIARLLDSRQGLHFAHTEQAWRAYFAAESQMQEMTTQHRTDGLAAIIAEGTRSELLRARALRLRGQLYDLRQILSTEPDRSQAR